jgi:hypothetical protein
MSTPGDTGPLGRPRGVGFGILMFIVTLGFYSWYWVLGRTRSCRPFPKLVIWPFGGLETSRCAGLPDTRVAHSASPFDRNELLPARVPTRRTSRTLRTTCAWIVGEDVHAPGKASRP